MSRLVVIYTCLPQKALQGAMVQHKNLIYVYWVSEMSSTLMSTTEIEIPSVHGKYG